jgi:protein translocase SecG subunit
MIILTILFILICILLVFMVVITPSQEGGMVATFGGLGSDSFFGTKAHQQISKFTVVLAVGFLVLAIWINKLNAGGNARPSGRADKVGEHVQPAPQAPGLPPVDLPPVAPPKK